MGVDAIGTITPSSEWSTGYASYRTHNIDKPEQEITIYAGLGRLAFLAEQEFLR